MSELFPSELINQYKNTSNKLQKIQKIVFKRFAPNVSEVSEEFNLLALNFDNSYLPQYAGLCWLGTAKCEKILGNSLSEVDALVKSADSFVSANKNVESLGIRSNNHEHIEGALRGYHQAAAKLEDDTAMKAAIIRKIKHIHPIIEVTSNFASPAHRIYDLEISAQQSILSGDFVAALDKLTEIYEDIIERKVQSLYTDVLKRNELSRLLLLLILDLPPARHSPSHIKLIERYTFSEDSFIDEISCDSNDFGLTDDTINMFQGLVLACKLKTVHSINKAHNDILNYPELTNEQHILLKKLTEKYI